MFIDVANKSREFYTISGLSLIILSTIFCSILNGITYPPRYLAFSLRTGISSFIYIFYFPFPFLASCTKFETGELPSNAKTTELLLSKIS